MCSARVPQIVKNFKEKSCEGERAKISAIAHVANRHPQNRLSNTVLYLVPCWKPYLWGRSMYNPTDNPRGIVR